MFRFAAVLLCLALPALANAQVPDTLKKIRGAKTVTIAYRTDALPFSFSGDDKQPAGYTVEVCKRVAASLEQQLKTPLQVKWVAATSQNRLELVQKGQADMECGATTATFSRMEIVDFSSLVFVDTTGLVVRKTSGVKSLGGLADKKIGVVAGTTNQRSIDAAIKKQLVSATVVPFRDRGEGMAALEAGSIDAFAGDKVLLLGLGTKIKDPAQYEVLADDLGFEPYAIVLPRNDSAFRLAVNRGLAQVFRSDAIVEIFRGVFGPTAVPTIGMRAMFDLGSFPE
jgi:glutamate/aspartate transport system substrate-binding protein